MRISFSVLSVSSVLSVINQPGSIDGSSTRMSNLRFNHVFTVLMLLSLVSAFFFPPEATNPGRAHLQGLFSPISRPARGIAGVVYRRFHRDAVVDDGSPDSPRPAQTVLEENRQLRERLALLSLKFDQLNQLNADRQLVGDDLRPLCKPATVTGADSSGVRETLALSAAGADFKADMPVLTARNIVGKLSRAGIGGAQVRLITDPGFSVTGRIGRYRANADGAMDLEWVEHLQPLVQGIGHGEMAIRSNISMQQVHDLGIAVNNMVVLDDRDWSANLHGCSLGRIISIDPQQNAPLFADIHVQPVNNLMRLREVMVMVKN